jgi:serine/threonine protein kinase HipA of HipAB toxin-antitoxin module
VIARLVRDGHLTAADEERFRRVHAFSKAIANDDAHLGNYGLMIDDGGKARLAPAYDVLPMSFAPKHDELPDRLVKHTGPRDADTDRLVQRLIAAVEADAGISAGFREAWLRVVA